MNQRRTKTIFFAIIILALLAGIFTYPKYFNQGADFINSKTKLGIPHFWDVPFKLGLDLQGGTHLIYEADLSGIEKSDYGSVMQGLRDVIERRINYFGVKEPIVQVQETGGKYRLIVELAGIKDSQEAIKLIGQTPLLEFKEERIQEERDAIIAKQKEVEGKTMEEVQKITDWQLAFQDANFKNTELTGKYLKKAELSFDPTTQAPLVSLKFTDEGAKIFEDLTSRNVNKILAIYIDGAPISTPLVNEKISGGSAQISGKFTIEEAKTLARNLSAGALPVPIKLISEQSVGPTLGMVSLEKSLIAGLYGLLGVIIFMIIYYRLPGLLASIALGIYVILVLSLFKMIPVTLTLAGIGGFILSIGMAVDANILIFARMREEIASGKIITGAVEEGFRRAWPSIRDSNLNSLIICAILFTFATSFIKGFALTLGLGILASMFSAIFITRIFLLIFVTKVEKFKWLL